MKRMTKTLEHHKNRERNNKIMRNSVFDKFAHV